MNGLGSSNRSNEPLRVLAMAVALVVAALAGAGIGFLIDLVDGDDTVVDAAAP